MPDVTACMCRPGACGGPEEGIRSLGTGVPESCKLPDVGAGDSSLVPRRDSLVPPLFFWWRQGLSFGWGSPSKLGYLEVSPGDAPVSPALVLR